MKVSLRISSSAVEFIHKMFERQSGEVVLVVTGFVVGTLKTLDGDDWDKRPFQDIVEVGRTLAESLPSKIMVEYVIGTKELDRVPQEDVHVVSGIKCYLPDDLITAIGAREIVLENGALRFEPRLEPFEVERHKGLKGSVTQ
jgi:hypothetical protein